MYRAAVPGAGVLAVKGQSPLGQDQDEVLLLPYTVVQKQLKGITWLDDILCSAVSAETIPLAQAQIADVAAGRSGRHGRQHFEPKLLSA